MQFSSISDLGITIADFRTWGLAFKFRLHLFFFLGEMLVSLEFGPGAFKFKVSYANPLTTETEVLMQKKSNVALLDVR